MEMHFAGRALILVLVFLTVALCTPGAKAGPLRLGNLLYPDRLPNSGTTSWIHHYPTPNAKRPAAPSGSSHEMVRSSNGIQVKSELITMGEVRQALAFASRIDEPGLTHSASPHLASLQNANFFRSGYYRPPHSGRTQYFNYSNEQDWDHAPSLRRHPSSRSYYYHPSRG